MLENLAVPKSQEESIPGREAHTESINKALKGKLGIFQKLKPGHCDRIIVRLWVFLKKKLHNQSLKVSVHKIYSQYKLYNKVIIKFIKHANVHERW